MAHLPTRENSIRLLLGIIIVAVQWIARFDIPAVFPEATPIGFLLGLVGWLALIVWWAFFSKAPERERLGGALLMIVGLAATPLILHDSLAKAVYGLIFVMYASPILSLAFIIWAIISRHMEEKPRRIALVAAVVVGCGIWSLIRMEGMTGGDGAEFAWRWTETAEERLLRQTESAT